MYQPRRRSAVGLWALILVAAGYGAALSILPTLTGSSKLDGSVGVVLGLFICSRPAANLVDLVLFGHVGNREILKGRALVWWLALNALVLVAGYLVLASGAMRFARP